MRAHAHAHRLPQTGAPKASFAVAPPRQFSLIIEIGRRIKAPPHTMDIPDHWSLAAPAI